MPEATALAESPELSSQLALDMLLANDGDTEKTVEKLGVPRATFVRALTAVPAETFSVIRLATMLRALDTVRLLGDDLAGKTDEMDGNEVARALQSMMGHVETFTRPAQTGAPAVGGGNVINVLLQHIPREAANAIKGVAAMDMDDLHDIRRLLQLKDGKITDTEDGDFKSL